MNVMKGCEVSESGNERTSIAQPWHPANRPNDGLRLMPALWLEEAQKAELGAGDSGSEANA